MHSSSQIYSVWSIHCIPPLIFIQRGAYIAFILSDIFWKVNTLQSPYQIYSMSVPRILGRCIHRIRPFRFILGGAYLAFHLSDVWGGGCIQCIPTLDLFEKEYTLQSSFQIYSGRSIPCILPLRFNLGGAYLAFLLSDLFHPVN